VSRRTERVASLIRTILGEAIPARLSDPRIEPLTSITRVEVSADLSVAHVYVSVMAEEAHQRLSVKALRHAAGRLRSLVAGEISLRQAPELDFRLDDSIQRSFETVQQLDRMMEELGERDPHAVEPDSDDSAPDGARNGTPDRPQPPASAPEAGDRICQCDETDGVQDVQEDI
jgi:ribosome-binding factor A